MTIAALISLRETFEASLVVCVVLAFLERTRRHDFKPAVWLGVATGVTVSILFAVILTLFADSLPAESHELYEGVMLLTAAALLLWMIVWMAGTGKDMKDAIERSAAAHIASGSFLGIFFISFTAAAREGVEMALMVHASLLSTGKPLHAVAGVGLGITGALFFAALLIRGIKLIPLRIFFTATTLLLLLLGSGLVMKGSGALIESFEGTEEHSELVGSAHHEEEASVPGMLAAVVYAGGAVLLWRKRMQQT